LAVLAAFLPFQFAPLAQRLFRLPRVLVQPSDKSSDALRIGLLGASFIGQVAVVHAAAKSHDVIVLAVASRDAKRASSFATKHGIPHAHGGESAYVTLLKRADIDAVYVSVPTRLHKHWALAALHSGKHVLVEKPIATNVQDAREMFDAAKRARRVIMEAAHYQYHPASLRMREIVTKARHGFGDIGLLESLKSDFSMIDPKAWLAASFPVSGVLLTDDRTHERVKNLDRWWYCVDSLIWSANASSVHVASAAETRYGMFAELEMRVPSSSQPEGSLDISASLSMARDKILNPFDWRLAAQGANGRRAQILNYGFAFLWHSVTVSSGTQVRSEQLYGQGETTFEHQLIAFVKEVREYNTSGGAEMTNSAHSKMSTSMMTMEVVDKIHEMTGGSISHQ